MLWLSVYVDEAAVAVIVIMELVLEEFVMPKLVMVMVRLGPFHTSTPHPPPPPVSSSSSGSLSLTSCSFDCCGAPDGSAAIAVAGIVDDVSTVKLQTCHVQKSRWGCGGCVRVCFNWGLMLCVAEELVLALKVGGQ